MFSITHAEWCHATLRQPADRPLSAVLRLRNVKTAIGYAARRGRRPPPLSRFVTAHGDTVFLGCAPRRPHVQYRYHAAIYCQVYIQST